MAAAHRFQLPMETGRSLDDDGAPVAWAACPDLPGAYEEAPTAEAARQALHDLARRILAEHLLRDDPLDPAIKEVAREVAAPTDDPALLTIAVREGDLEAARNAPLLFIEQPEP